MQYNKFVYNSPICEDLTKPCKLLVTVTKQLSSDKLPLYCRADSVVWNIHKLLAAPQQCSMLLVRHPNIIKACHACNAAYLFQKDKFYDVSFDFGDKYLQCGRRADVFKFWFMWKAKVILLYAEIITTIFLSLS
jgi:glutamate/tyrosine decarboxylase-like PLP-dependent enzyme